jgi:hypothetical protein
MNGVSLLIILGNVRPFLGWADDAPWEDLFPFLDFDHPSYWENILNFQWPPDVLAGWRPV